MSTDNEDMSSTFSELAAMITVRNYVWGVVQGPRQHLKKSDFPKMNKLAMDLDKELIAMCLDLELEESDKEDEDLVDISRKIAEAKAKMNVKPQAPVEQKQFEDVVDAGVMVRLQAEKMKLSNQQKRNVAESKKASPAISKDLPAAMKNEMNVELAPVRKSIKSSRKPKEDTDSK